MAKPELEGRVASGFVYGGHDLKTDARQGADPAFLVSFNMKTDTLIDSLIRLLASAIRLWVKARGHLLFYACE